MIVRICKVAQAQHKQLTGELENGRILTEFKARSMDRSEEMQKNMDKRQQQQQQQGNADANYLCPPVMPIVPECQGKAPAARLAGAAVQVSTMFAPIGCGPTNWANSKMEDELAQCKGNAGCCHRRRCNHLTRLRLNKYHSKLLNRLFLLLLIAYEIFIIYSQANRAAGSGALDPVCSSSLIQRQRHQHQSTTNLCLKSLLSAPISACSALEISTTQLPEQPATITTTAAAAAAVSLPEAQLNDTNLNKSLAQNEQVKSAETGKVTTTTTATTAATAATATATATGTSQADETDLNGIRSASGAAKAGNELNLEGGDKQTETSTMPTIRQRTSDVVCNSRCNCVRLEFGEQLSSDSSSSGKIETDKTTTAATKTGTMDDDELGMSANKTTTTTTTTADANQIALIEFGQDYSFDEHDELAGDDATQTNGGQLHERDELYAGATTFETNNSNSNAKSSNSGAAAAASASASVVVDADGEQQQQQQQHQQAPGLSGSGFGHNKAGPATSLMWLPEAPLPHLGSSSNAGTGAGNGADLLDQFSSGRQRLGAGSGHWRTIKTAATTTTTTTASGADQSSGSGTGGASSWLSSSKASAAALNWTAPLDESKSSSTGNESGATSSPATAKRHKKQRLMIDQLNQLVGVSGPAGASFKASRAHDQLDLDGLRPPTPLNGHSLLLPSFNIKQKQQQTIYGNNKAATVQISSGGGASVRNQAASQAGGGLAHELTASPGGGSGNSVGGVGGVGGTGDKLFSSLHSHLQHNYQRHHALFNNNSSSNSEQQAIVIERIAPLNALDLSNKNLGQLLVSNGGGGEQQQQQQQIEHLNQTQLLKWALKEMSRPGANIESLVLRNNNIKFELWTQLYSLILVQMRSRLYHLDLSHNSLIKLGVTFTGYIEHHFVYQLLRSNNTDQSWPFSIGGAAAVVERTTTTAKSGKTAQYNNATAGEQQQQDVNTLNRATALGGGGGGTLAATSKQQLEQPSLAAAANYMSNYLTLINQFKMSSSSTSSLPSSPNKRLFRRPILGDGRIYNLIRAELPLLLELPAPLQPGLTNGNESVSSSSTDNYNSQRVNNSDTSLNAPNTTTTTTSQQLIRMILHQSAKIRALDLSYNKLKWLINDQFRILKHLQTIRLDHNRIRFIHQQAFNGLVSLKYLNLNYNRLQTIYMEQFQTNYNLLALFMKANYLTYLRAGSLASQANLKRLDLSRNKFAIMSNNAFVGLDSLELLNLSSNSFVHVPSASFHPLMISLKQLDLSDNQIAQLMPGAFFHLQLEQIWFNDNDQLVSIDRGAFWDLPRLTHLSLKSNSLLMSVNQQAFVGVPSLKSINTAECPLLDTQTRQMLDNVTTVGTKRSLFRQQQQQIAQQQIGARSNSSSNSSSGLPLELTGARVQSSIKNTTRVSGGGSSDPLSQQQQSTTIPIEMSTIDSLSQQSSSGQQLIANNSEATTAAAAVTNSSATLSEQKTTITTTTTTDEQQRLLVAVQNQNQNQNHNPNYNHNYHYYNNNNNNNAATTTSSTKSKKSQLSFIDFDAQNEYQQQMSIKLQYDETSATLKITKYFYSLGGLVLIVIVLKLLFKYTSTRHYLNLRRQRRRVYQASSSLTPATCDTSAKLNHDDNQDDHDLDDECNLSFTGSSSASSSSSSSSALASSSSSNHYRPSLSSNCSLAPSSVASPARNRSSTRTPVAGAAAAAAASDQGEQQSFAMIEQQPQNVIKIRSSPASVGPPNELNDQVDTTSQEVDSTGQQQQQQQQPEVSIDDGQVNEFQCPDCLSEQQQQQQQCYESGADGDVLASAIAIAGADGSNLEFNCAQQESSEQQMSETNQLCCDQSTVGQHEQEHEHEHEQSTNASTAEPPLASVADEAAPSSVSCHLMSSSDLPAIDTTTPTAAATTYDNDELIRNELLANAGLYDILGHANCAHYYQYADLATNACCSGTNQNVAHQMDY